MASVLVVDDDPNARLLVTTLLAHAGHSAIAASDGAQGFELVIACRPDLVMIDLAMPAMSGPEFIRALRADERTRGTRVALYTATEVDAALRDFMAIYDIAGALPKPADPRRLLAEIEALLK